MELNREHFCAIIYYNFQRQLSQQECLADLSDDPRVGAPKTAVTQENVDAVRKLIIEDRHVTYREIEASLKISKTLIQKNLHEQLGVRKLVSRWIPHLLTEEQKAARVNWCQKTLDHFNSGNSKNVCSIFSGDESWIYCEEKSTKVIRSRSRDIATIPLNEQRTVTADWYTTICLPKVITELRKINPERRIILHQDNASSHTAQKTRQYLTEENVELLDHPPYSLDLSPNYFFNCGQRFQSPEEATDAFKNAVLDLPANEWNECFENWFERMQITAEIFNERHENSNVHRKYVLELVAKFRETGSVANKKRNIENPIRILKAHSFHPYKIHLVQELNEDDFDRRLQFCEDMNAIDPALTAIIENQNDRRYIANRLMFQQDGAPPHYVLRVRQYLDQTFPDRWIGRRGVNEWPPRSPDLSPLDFFMDLPDEVNRKII
ncbi:unnamed protein product [Acanthoscelides obtectus]|uniref:Transposase n=1 Tax=Acanthoscelides obtectus TaxID=200917 RepID=A0A9P0L2W6_ACAOB|nr:unnamed protein product [Acanthoscelides obtectus]CAK1679649.1 Histone-lysine N-methyltransferase SETMAR [Acanthoscelides obtectus]